MIIINVFLLMSINKKKNCHLMEFAVPERKGKNKQVLKSC